MSKHADEFTSPEELLTLKICRQLEHLKISFRQQVLCEFTELDSGYIDILIESSPPCLIEVKGSSQTYRLYGAIGQLLAYSSCYPTAELYLAVPDVESVSTRLLPILERVGIRLWGGVHTNYTFPFRALDMSAPHYCQVCDHPARDDIELAMRRGVNLSVIATQRRLRRDILAAHQSSLACQDAALKVEESDEPAPRQAKTPQYSSTGQPSMRRRIEAIERALQAAEEPEYKRPLALVQEGWRAAKDDLPERTKIIAWINDQLLQQDEMGFP